MVEITKSIVYSRLHKTVLQSILPLYLTEKNQISSYTRRLLYKKITLKNCIKIF